MDSQIGSSDMISKPNRDNRYDPVSGVIGLPGEPGKFHEFLGKYIPMEWCCR